MSVEGYLLVNLLADAALLRATTRALGLPGGRRLWLSAALCAAYALVAALYPNPLASPPAQLSLLAALSLWLSRPAVRLWGLVAPAILCCALLCGGAASLLPLEGWRAGLAGVVLGSAALLLLCGIRPPASGGWQISVGMAVGGRTVCFPALVDTGNRLREPVTGLPVLIAEAALLKGALPEDGFRELDYGAVGGAGRMACFRPGEVWVERGLRRLKAPDIWVALAPGSLPGAFQALAPPEFALYMK